MAGEHCALCERLESAGVGSMPRELCPPEAGRLEVFAPGEGHGGNAQLRRGPDCGAFYQYRHHYEVDVTGSWDEDWLWRLPEAGRALSRVLDPATPEERVCSELAVLLGAEESVLRVAAALAAWILAGQGRPLPVPELVLGLIDADFAAGNACYRALLSFLRRGREASARVLAALDASEVEGQDTHFCWILRKEATAILAG